MKIPRYGLTVACFLLLVLPAAAPLSAQSTREEAMVDLYRFLLQPKTMLIDNLINRDQEVFIGVDTAFSFTPEVPWDGIYALFAADHYHWEKADVNGLWYAGFYARQGELVTSRIPLAFTVGWTMRLPGRAVTSWAFDWTWFGLTSDEDDDRNYLSLGLYGLRYGIGFRNLFEVEYHTWGIYDFDVLVGWLSAFLKWDTISGDYYTDVELANIRISPYLAFSIAALLQLISEDRLGADYWYLWPSLELTLADRDDFTLNLLAAGGVVKRDGEYLWGFFAGFDLVSRDMLSRQTGSKGILPVWIRAGVGVDDREARERLRAPGRVTMQLTIGLLWDAPEKNPPDGERKKPFWERLPFKKKKKQTGDDTPPSDTGNPPVDLDVEASDLDVEAPEGAEAAEEPAGH